MLALEQQFYSIHSLQSETEEFISTLTWLSHRPQKGARSHKQSGQADKERERARPAGVNEQVQYLEQLREDEAAGRKLAVHTHDLAGVKKGLASAVEGGCEAGCWAGVVSNKEPPDCRQ